MTAAHAAQITRTPHVFVAGSLMAEPLIQEVVARQFDVRRWNNAAGVDDMVSDNPSQDGNYRNVEIIFTYPYALSIYVLRKNLKSKT